MTRESAARRPPVLALTTGQRIIELARPWLLLIAYLVCAIKGLWLFAVFFAVVTCLAGFIQMHDAIHNALGLSKRSNGIVLALSGLLLLKSGHALKVTHLRHHGRCLSEDDPEGRPANWPLSRVMLAGPFHMLTLRWSALKIAPQTSTRQLVETAATVLVLLAALSGYLYLHSFVGIVYWAIAAGLSAAMPLWAAYLPHRLAPRNPAIIAASKLARIWTPVVSSFAFHHVHHHFPKVPTALLPLAAREVTAEQLEHHH